MHPKTFIYSLGLLLVPQALASQVGSDTEIASETQVCSSTRLGTFECRLQTIEDGHIQVVRALVYPFVLMPIRIL